MTQSQKAPPSEPGPQSEFIIVGTVALTVVVTVVLIMVVTVILLVVAVVVRIGVGLKGVYFKLFRFKITSEVQSFKCLSYSKSKPKQWVLMAFMFMFPSKG